MHDYKWNVPIAIDWSIDQLNVIDWRKDQDPNGIYVNIGE
jgi:hypothetical protein